MDRKESLLVSARPTAGYSATVRLRIRNVPGSFLRVSQQIADLNGSMSDVHLVYGDFNYLIRDITINAPDEDSSIALREALKSLDGIELLHWRDDTFHCHEGGKLEVLSKIEVKTSDELSRAYTPGVARVCTKIHEEPDTVYRYTMKGSTVAVVTDGSAVLGLGNIGPEAAMPVMEGKAVLFQQFAGVNAFPICLNTQDTEEIIQAVKWMAPGFGGINLEDISGPRCFEIEDRLRAELDIPVFHDDQHGTAVVVFAGILNALKIIGKNLSDCKIVVSGFGAGGVACTRMLLAAGVRNIIPCDSAGIVYRGRKERMNPVKEKVIQETNPENMQGSIADALKGADIFIGVSQPGVVTREMVQSMAKDPIVFALANPNPEVKPEEIEDIARIVATGRSDYANQVNNVLCFPGILKGAMDVRATDITENMRIAAAQAIAQCVSDSELHENNIIPSVFQGDIAGTVAAEVRKTAEQDGVARTKYVEA